MEDLEWGKWNNLTLNAQPETPTSGKWYVALQNTMKTWGVLSDIIWPYLLEVDKSLVAFLHKMEDMERGKWNNLTLTTQPETPERAKWCVALLHTMKT